jgi:F0F1-type ATP synthase assembly protein I
MRTPDRDTRFLAGAGAAGAIGFILAFAVVLGAGGGYLLDQWLHTQPILTTVGLALGATGGFIRVIQIAKKWSKD